MEACVSSMSVGRAPAPGTSSRGHPSYKLSEGMSAGTLAKGRGLDWSPLLVLSIPITRCLSHQFSSVAQSCPTLCNPMDCSSPGLPVHHQLVEFTQTHVH